MDNSAFKMACAIVFVVIALFGSYWMHFFLPVKEVYVLSGTDAKRLEGSQQNEDSFYIYAKQGERVVAFRNINTGFGFPPYFKLNATDLQAEVQGRAGQTVLIEYYGWRNKWFNTFPNVLQIRAYEEGMGTTSWTRGVVYTLWLLLLLLLFPRFFSLMERKHIAKASRRSKV